MLVKVKKVLSITDDNTTVILRNNRLEPIAIGKWYYDQIVDHSQDPVKSFTWHNDNTLYIDLKEV